MDARIKKKIRKLIQTFGFYPGKVIASDRWGICEKTYKNVKVQRAFRKWSTIDQARLKTLKNCHVNKDRCFVIGNGPSLKKTDLTLLKNDITFGVNAIFLIGFIPTYYVVADNLVCEDRAEEINQFSGAAIKFFPVARAYCIQRNKDTVFYVEGGEYKKYPGFSKNVSEYIFPDKTVTYANLQLAYHMGFKKVYLIGMDHDYTFPSRYDHEKVDKGSAVITSKSNDPNHFHPDYFGKGFRWRDPEMHLIEAAYRKAKSIFEDEGRIIYNATIGGKLEIFERVEYLSLFKHREIDKY